MFPNFDAFQKLSKDQIEATTAAASEVTKGLQNLAVEASDFSKKSIENNTAFVEKMLGARKIEDALQLQGEYMRSSYEGLVSQMTKMGELYGSIAREAFKPVEGALNKAKDAAQG